VSKYDLTFERVSELLCYDPTTGHLIRTVGRPGGGKKGSRAGTLRSDGYRSVEIDGYAYLEHIVAWLLMTGEWPTMEIDHEDRNPNNNVWRNLREATRSQNCLNTGTPKSNQLGVKGVRKMRDKFQVRLKVNGIHYHIGTFPTLDEAVEAREAKYKELLSA